MPPQATQSMITDDEIETKSESKKPYQTVIVWRNVILFALLHLGSVYGLYMLIFQAKWATVAWTFFLYYFGGVGITAGAHRLWAHRTYKAKWPLKLLLVIMNTVAFQNDVIEWARDHRVHHKYSETDADPHNATRGFFFAHIGWLLVRKHPDVKEKGKQIDMSDLMEDPLLRFQRKYYPSLVLLGCFIIPTIVPTYWGESAFIAFYTAGLLKYCVTLHATWMVNSVAHMWGFRPYDENISPRESAITSIGACGEGWHNYHHTFPTDYKTSELPWKLNFTTMFIDFFALFGWAYDRKTISKETIAARRAKTGAERA